jgi:hypothetical protein
MDKQLQLPKVDLPLVNMARLVSDLKVKEKDSFYPCEIINTDGFLLNKAYDMLAAGEYKFENNHRYCTVFDEKQNKNIVVKFYSPPNRQVSSKLEVSITQEKFPEEYCELYD